MQPWALRACGIGASLELETVLQEVVDGARVLTDARVAFIATIDGTGAPEHFVSSGLTEGEYRRLLEWPDGRHAVLIDLPPDLPRVMADRERIARVLDNLLVNAARQAPESSLIAPERLRSDRAPLPGVRPRVRNCTLGKGAALLRAGKGSSCSAHPSRLTTTSSRTARCVPTTSCSSPHAITRSRTAKR